MSRRARSASAMACVFGLVAACAQPDPRAHVVTIRDFAFKPSEITVSRGDTVVWSNADFVPHTTTARDATWDSKSIGASATWRTVAGTVGRHEYYCAFHPTMTATVIVR